MKGTTIFITETNDDKKIENTVNQLTYNIIWIYIDLLYFIKFHQGILRWKWKKWATHHKFERMPVPSASSKIIFTTFKFFWVKYFDQGQKQDPTL